MKVFKNLWPYIVLALSVTFIVLFVVLPSNGTKELICLSSGNETGISTYFDLKIVYKNGSFEEVYNNVVFDLSKNWIEKDVYVSSISSESSVYTDMGFEYKVETDSTNKQVITKMYGNKDTLNNELIFFSKIDKVEEHYESQGYICEVEDFK